VVARRRYGRGPLDIRATCNFRCSAASARTLIYTLRTSDVSRRLPTFAAALAIGGVGLAIVSAALTGRTGARGAIDSGVASLSVLLTAFGVGRRLVGHHEVSASTLAGALCIYLLIGLFLRF